MCFILYFVKKEFIFEEKSAKKTRFRLNVKGTTVFGFYNGKKSTKLCFPKQLPLPVSAAIRTSPPPRMRGMASAYKYGSLCQNRHQPFVSSQNTSLFTTKKSIKKFTFSQEKPWRFKTRTKLILL
jgi:hypothetical protein